MGLFQDRRLGHYRINVSWLVAASLFFYGWWNPAYLGLLIGSVQFNYSVGVGLAMGSPSPSFGKKGLLKKNSLI